MKLHGRLDLPKRLPPSKVGELELVKDSLRAITREHLACLIDVVIICHPEVPEASGNSIEIFDHPLTNPPEPVSVGFRLRRVRFHNMATVTK